MSRKTLGFVVAIIGAILTVFQEQFGLKLDPAQMIAGIGAILTYIFFEAKLDLKALKMQPNKWRDGKFWLTLLSALLTIIWQTFNIPFPIETVIAGLTALVGIMFGTKFKKPIPY